MTTTATPSATGWYPVSVPGPAEYVAAADEEFVPNWGEWTRKMGYSGYSDPDNTSWYLIYTSPDGAVYAYTKDAADMPGWPSPGTMPGSGTSGTGGGSGSTTANKTAIKAIQTALKSQGFNPGPIDGIFGPLTCGAAYSFKLAKLNDSGKTLTPAFFAALGLAGKGYDTKFANSCDPWFTETVVPPSPIAATSKIPLVLGAIAGGLGGVLGGKKIAPKTSMLVTTAIGAAFGLVGGTVYMAVKAKKAATTPIA